MTLNFPSPATLNQIYTSPPQQWIWDGAKWGALNSQGSLSLYLPLTGGSLSGPGNLAVGGTLAVTGNTTHSGTLAVTGATTLGAATGVTPATADSSLNLATTAFVKNQGYATTASVNSSLVGYLPLSGGTLSGGLTGTTGTFSGNLIGNNSVQSNGVYFQNSGGQFYTPNQFLSNSNVIANGALYTGGTSIYWQSNGGYMYTNQNLQSAGTILTGGNVIGNNSVQSNGVYFQNSSGYFYTPQPILSGSNIIANGNVYAGGGGGVYFYNYGGWFRSNAGMYCDNINISGCVVDNPGSAIRSNGHIYMIGHNVPWNDNSYYCGVSPWGNNWYAVCSYNFVNVSDRSLKTDFTDLPDCLDLVRAIKPQRFRWIDSPSDKRRLHWGFVAQDVGEAMDGAGHDFGGYRIDRAEDSEGHMRAGEERHSLAHNELMAVLWKAVQELSARLDALEA